MLRKRRRVNDRDHAGRSARRRSSSAFLTVENQSAALVSGWHLISSWILSAGIGRETGQCSIETMLFEGVTVKALYFRFRLVPVLHCSLRVGYHPTSFDEHGSE
jgi:hypothetical protein